MANLWYVVHGTPYATLPLLEAFCVCRIVYAGNTQPESSDPIYVGVVVVQYSGHPTLVSRCTTNRGDIISLTYDEAFQPQPRTYIYVRAFITDSAQSVFITQRYYTGFCVSEISKDLRILLRTY